MSNIIDNPKVKLKTYSFYINNKNDNRIFDLMTSISKNIYNCPLYCYKVYKQFEDNIYKDLYDDIIKNNLDKITAHKSLEILKLLLSDVDDNVVLVRGSQLFN